MKNSLVSKEEEDMFAPLVILPAKDVYIQLPLGLMDRDIKLMFRNVEAIDSAIEQLQKLRPIMVEKEGKML